MTQRPFKCPTARARVAKYAIRIAAAGLLAAQGFAYAAPTDLSTVPLASTSTADVKPNILFVLDDSGSMGWSHMPDSIRSQVKQVGYKTHLCNRVYYNPANVYLPPRKADGTSFPDASFTAAPYDGFDSGSSKVDLSSKFKAYDDDTSWGNGDDKEQPAYYYALKSGVTFASSMCTEGSSDSHPHSSTNFVKTQITSATEQQNFANWYSYYRLRMMMMKSASGRAFVQLSSKYRVGFITINPGSPVSSTKYLPTKDFDTAHKADWFNKLYSQGTGSGTPLREALSRAGRYFAGVKDTGINKGITDDPVQYSCQQNFAILTTDGLWNGNEGDDLNGASLAGKNQDGVLSETWSPRPMWDGSSNAVEKTTTTNNTYAVVGCGSGKTRIRKTSVSTTRTVTKSGTAVISDTTSAPSTSTSDGICDKTAKTAPPPDTTVSTTSSGGTTMSDNSLADVAQYYYKNDLRTPTSNPIGALGNPVHDNNVPAATSSPEDDRATHQHMTTFTLGLGVNGNLTYRSDYKTATSGDYFDIKNGTKSWPVPSANDPTTADDLWHTAVNGRGQYFSAQDPDEVVSGLQNALTGINKLVASAAAAATSNLEPVAGDNFAYTASYTTLEWWGELEAKTIDLSTGVVSETPVWKATTKIGAKVGAACDNRTIYLFRSGATNNLAEFKWNTDTCKTDGTPVGSPTTTLTDSEKAHFDAEKVKLLSQYPAMTDGSGGTLDQRSPAAGANLVNFLRGQTGKERFEVNDVNRLYRDRVHALGDIVNAQPVFVKAPFADYKDTGYAAFKSAKAGRTPMVYVAANDGMLHAFNANDGDEAWAFMPTMVLANLYKLADNNYANLHEYFVDGTPTVGDVYIGGEWRTILVGGMQRGGRGYYALDITDPAAPKALWEFAYSDTCYDGSAGTAGADCHVGYTFGNPVISKLDDGTWVVLVTSGINNTSASSPAADDGKGYLYVLDAQTGKIKDRIATAAGSSTTPSGLTKIVNWVNDTLANNTTERLYGVDLLGNVWVFDVNDRAELPPAGKEATLLATLTDKDGYPQPITTKPELAETGSPPSPIVLVATGRYLGMSDIGDTKTQSIYAIKDPLGGFSYGSGVRSALAQCTITLVPDPGDPTRSIRQSSCTGGTPDPDGWFIDLPDAGERVNVDMKLQLGVLVVATNVPQSSACLIGGYSYINYFNYQTGAAPSGSMFQSVGMKLADSLAVGLNIVRLPNNKTVIITTTSDAKQRTVEQPPEAVPPTGKRISWREIVQ
jgi:type IV pilus assembly protein PilY1